MQLRIGLFIIRIRIAFKTESFKITSASKITQSRKTTKGCLLRDAGGGIATQNYILNETSEKAVFNEVEERIVKCSLDFIILKAAKREALSGYNVISLIHRKFGVLLSAGSVYALLYSLERKGLVKAAFNHRARCYSLTEKGKETLNVITSMQDRIQTVFNSIL
jgi:predicted transcriptional regulator